MKAPKDLNVKKVAEAIEVDAEQALPGLREALAEAAGGRLLNPAQPTFWGGYGGCLQDPDGHVWEVVFNPYLRTLG